jgi:drug/metabolite transporter (DMT)-like permease
VTLRLWGKRRYVVLAFGLLVLFWGSAFSVVKVGLEYSPPMIFAGLRTLMGGLVILLVSVVWGGSPHLRCDWPIFVTGIYTVNRSPTGKDKYVD